MNQRGFPPGRDEERARKILGHYEKQTEEEAVAEDEAVVTIVESDQEVEQ